ncbi:selenocysteine-specific elongation factor [Desulfosarcina sp. BuS5]|uniref:selenocysteine-specific translation elongation factor n=1 Tax=Desulfosarcina sp. BuS5 TaxID=933262 RepID=UPI0006886EC4|nr:selenocysteine-specific translation elongation factor [Desulfosarcina sp. BuS5]WDN88814.1 selenocysteine-specific elongation factor [Desulfosarcina sp. BuS5]
MKKFITIGIAGHVDHGKTSLSLSLTGIDTDRLQEEKRRGLSIVPGIAPLELSSGKQIALVDVPGHIDFFKNTIRGLSSIDMAVLVVAADDGIMPQTLEHLEILNFYKVKNGFVVLSKADLVDDETLELAELEIEDMISGTFFEGKPIIPFSAIDLRGLNEIRLTMEEEEKKIAGKAIQSSFRLWIDQVRSITGFGTVVNGTVLSGIIRQNDLIHLLPSGKETRARFIEVHHQKVSQAVAGQRVGINLHKVTLNEVQRGMALAKPESVRPTKLLNVELHLLKSAYKPIKNRQRVKLYIGTSIVNALVVIMEKEQLGPGENGLVQFRLLKHAPALPGDTFVICLLNIPAVIGGGAILEIPLEKYRTVKAKNTVQYLQALQEGNMRVVIDHFFNMNLNHPVTGAEIAQLTALPDEEVETAIRSMVENREILSFEGHGFFGKTRYQTLKRKLPEVVEKILTENPLKMTATPEEIKQQLAPSLDEAPFQKILAELCNERKLIKTGGAFRIRNFSVKLSAERERLITMLLDYARESDFVPFNAHTFWKLHKRKFNKNEIQRLLDYLHIRKRLICLNNRRFLTPQAMEQIKNRVEQIIKKNGSITIANCKEILGYGRTVPGRSIGYPTPPLQTRT